MPLIRRPRLTGWPLALLAPLLLLAACAPSDPPPSSPLDDETGTQNQTGPRTPTPLPTIDPPEASVSATSIPSVTPTSDAAAEAERVTGEAITRLAEWIGAPETDFRLTSIEAVDWPDACLGIQNPAVACAEVITPGYRVTLHHVAAPDALYLVHASKAGHYAWAPTYKPTPRTIAATDPDTGYVTLEPLDSDDDLLGTTLRTVPGSYLDVPLSDLPPGQRVSVGAAAPISSTTDPDAANLIVFLVPIAE